jgi:hypothetical protein
VVGETALLADGGHGTAMHLLQSGVDLAVIALWLGHEKLQTTNVDITADVASKEQALEKLEPIPDSFARHQGPGEVLAFLGHLMIMPIVHDERSARATTALPQ